MKKLAAILLSMLCITAAACSSGGQTDLSSVVSDGSVNTAVSATVSEEVSQEETKTDSTVSKEDDNMIAEDLTVLDLPYGNDRTVKVRVYVPAHQEGETLPVIYMTDGQNLFEDTTVRFGCWYTREAVRAEQEKNGRGAVIVGIHNDGDEVQRTIDLTPASIGELNLSEETMTNREKELYAMFHPAAEAFTEFVVNTVMPAVEQQFPVKTGRTNTAFCGSSSGGLESFFIALSYPDKFSAAGVFSPAMMYYSLDTWTAWVKSKMQDTMPFLYCYAGRGEAREEYLANELEPMFAMLQTVYPQPDKLLKKVIDEDQMHNESAWEVYFVDFLKDFLDITASS